jgi:hypothetical protein
LEAAPLGNKKEFKVKINVRLKKMSDKEYSVVAGLWKQMMLDLEEKLRANLRTNMLDYKTFKDLDKGFDFASLAALEVPISAPSLGEPMRTEVETQPTSHTAVEQTPITPKAESPPIAPVEQPTSQPQEPLISPTVSQPSVAPTQPPAFSSSSVVPAPQQKPQPSLESLAGLAKSTPASAIPPSEPEFPVKPAPGIPKVPTTGETRPKAPDEEEDRATGIAILRQQMLSELKKIRGIIETKE